MQNSSTQSLYTLITGGAGFIGTNLALSYLQRGEPVHIFDNLNRRGGERNVAHLLERFPGRVLFTQGDVRRKGEVEKAVGSARAVCHLAAQVAVTTSLEDPVADAETNLLGTLNILEAIRGRSARPPLLFTSTNKVYGGLTGVDLRDRGTRYEPAAGSIAEAGVSEDQPLEFLSPYGCSKGSADQYVLDYARSYGLRAIVFRMSCIYGPYQMGSEDQGWVAHFARQALKGEAITIYGDGKQVRDLLYVGDLVRAIDCALSSMRSCSGEVFNMGGGPGNSTSLLEIVAQLKHLTGSRLQLDWGAERMGDQRWYVADTSKAGRLLNWKPEVSIREGLKSLLDWYSQNPELVGQSNMQVA